MRTTWLVCTLLGWLTSGYTWTVREIHPHLLEWTKPFSSVPQDDTTWQLGNCTYQFPPWHGVPGYITNTATCVLPLPVTPDVPLEVVVQATETGQTVIEAWSAHNREVEFWIEELGDGWWLQLENQIEVIPWQGNDTLTPTAHRLSLTWCLNGTLVIEVDHQWRRVLVWPILRANGLPTHFGLFETGVHVWPSTDFSATCSPTLLAVPWPSYTYTSAHTRLWQVNGTTVTVWLSLWQLLRCASVLPLTYAWALTDRELTWPIYLNGSGELRWTPGTQVRTVTDFKPG